MSSTSESHKPVVFLFGAGASTGAAENVVPRRPPLGRELYNELASFAPATWGPGSYLGRYGDTFRTNFEEAMNEVVLHAPTIDLLEWLRELSRYFAQFTLDGAGADPYSRLLRSLHQHDAVSGCVFASLNYECLLELSASGMGIQVAYETHGDGQMEVLKVHGSSNFVTDDLTSQRYLLTNPGSGLGCRFTALAPLNLEAALNSRFTGLSGYFPVTSLYAWGKSTPVGNVQMQGIRNRFAEAVHNASVVVIVGVMANSEDRHVWTPVSQTSADVYCVGSASLLDGWQVANALTRSVGERFQDSIDRIVGCLPI